VPGFAHKSSDAQEIAGLHINPGSASNLPIMERFIIFNWSGEAPSEEAAQAFVDAATDALIGVAERYGCRVNGGFQIAASSEA